MDFNIFCESKSKVAEPVLTIKRNIQSCLFLILVVLNLPSRSLAVNGIYLIGIPVICERIGNKLSFLSVYLAICGETAFRITQSHQSLFIIIFEVNSKH